MGAEGLGEQVQGGRLGEQEQGGGWESKSQDTFLAQWRNAEENPTLYGRR